jgi:hypothetical protein
MEGAVLAGETLADDLGRGIDEDGHGFLQARATTTPAAAGRRAFKPPP